MLYWYKIMLENSFRPRYKDYRITKWLGNARVEVSDNHGKLSVRHITDVKQISPIEHAVQHIPDCTGMGHHCTLTVNPDMITDLQWHVTDRTLLENLAEMAVEAVEANELYTTWL